MTLRASHIRIIRARTKSREPPTERSDRRHLTGGLLPLRFIIASWREDIPGPLMKGFLPECYKPFSIEKESTSFLPNDID
jgi:hypothetical protein